MKKILFAMLTAALIMGAAAVPATSNAQLLTQKISVDTTTNAATSYATYLPASSNIFSVQATIKRLTGTVAGYTLLQVTNDNVSWVDANTDTMFVAANTTYASKAWQITHTHYYGYRLTWKQTSSGTTSTLTGTWLRRVDEIPR